jgi:hypothetical protein
MQFCPNFNPPCYKSKDEVSAIIWLLILHFIATDCTGRFRMFSVITNIYNKKTKGPTSMEFFTAKRKKKKVFC